MKKWLPYYFLIIATMIGSFAGAQQVSVEAVIAGPAVSGFPRVYVSPNPIPVNSFCYVEIDSCELNDTDRIVIYNSQGFIVHTRELRMQEGNNKFLLNFSGFEPGNYTVRLYGRDIPDLSFSKQLIMHF